MYNKGNLLKVWGGGGGVGVKGIPNPLSIIPCSFFHKGIQMTTRRKLCQIKGISEAKMEKIKVCIFHDITNDLHLAGYIIWGFVVSFNFFKKCDYYLFVFIYRRQLQN